MFAQDTLTENNYRLFFGLALDVLIRPWEKLVLVQKYNEVPLIGRGAPRPFTLSADLFIHRFFSPSSLFAARRRPFRSRFTSDHDVSFFPNRLWRRARQVRAASADRHASQPRSCASIFQLFFFFFVWCDSDVMLVSVRAKQEEDVDEFYNGSGITWKLSEQDARTIAGLRL